MWATEVLIESWTILKESAGYMLVGFVLAALLRQLLAKWRFADLLRGRGPGSVLLASLVGVPLPLCSCSVLPAAISLRRSGASNGATLSFLISVPETSVTSIALTYALIGPFMAVVRPVASLITAIVAGLTQNFIEERSASQEGSTAKSAKPPAAAGQEDACGSDCGDSNPEGSDRSLKGAFRFAFVDLFDDIAGWLIVGIVAAALLNVAVGPERLDSILGGPIQSMLIMLVIGVPLYVCAESSTPVAAALIVNGLNPGAALVFLLVGPATNLGSIGVLRRQMGGRAVGVYLFAVAGVALVAGAIVNLAGDRLAVDLSERALSEPIFSAEMKVIGAIAFLMLLAGSMYRTLRFGRARPKA